jgi:hypothetical protein
MTNPADHQTGLPKPVTGQKRHPHQEEIPHPVQIKPIAGQEKNIAANVREKKDLFHHQQASHTRAGKVVMINQQAVLVEAQVKNVPFLGGKSHIQAERLISMISLKETPIAIGVAANHRGKRNHLLQEADRIQVELLIMMKGLKEVLGEQHQVVNRSHPVVNHLQVLLMQMTDQKEALVMKGPAIKNLAKGHLLTLGLKKHIAINQAIPKGHNVQDHHMIK